LKHDLLHRRFQPSAAISNKESAGRVRDNYCFSYFLK
jgi:hypothetical protein